MIFKQNQLSMYYQKYGTHKNTILILPGWGNTRPTFQNIINQFQENHTIYIIDYPGFGNSPIPKKELTINDYALLIKSFIEKKKIKNPIIIAHSFGGRITSLLLSKYQIKTKKIILIDVAGIKRRKKLSIFLKEKIYKILKKTIIILPKKKQIIYQKKLLQIFASNDYKSLPQSMRKSFQNIIRKDLKKNYKQIHTETLIIWGQYDQDTPLKDAFYLKKHIKNSALIIYKNATHFSYLQYPNITISIIQSFIQEKETQ